MVYIIAECGVNFTSLTEAKTMIAKAYGANADAVKFQVYDHDNLCKVYSGGDVERHPLYDELMDIKLGLNELKELKEYADNIGINLLATPMYPEAVEILEELQVDRYKIRYADRYNNELIKKVKATGKPIIISCDEYYMFITKHTNISCMFCISKYPPEPSDFKHFPIRFSNNTIIGYSNHFPSIAPALIAVSRGCQIVEMHVKLEGTQTIDDAVSITFEQLRELVKLVKEMELYLQCSK